MQVQDPIEASWDSEPEPDLALASRKPPRGRLLRTALLVIEVAVSSHQADRNEKATLYANADIPIYWLVDVPARSVEVRTQPDSDCYAKCAIYHVGELVPSPLEEVADLDVADLFADVDS
jgi:Uma2 family endonuclease